MTERSPLSTRDRARRPAREADRDGRHWRIVDSFPITVTGKVQKYRLRELAVEERRAA